MTRFLIALLREGAPSVCYWVVPSAVANGEERKQKDFETEFEFDVRHLAWPAPATMLRRWRGVNLWLPGNERHLGVGIRVGEARARSRFLICAGAE
jgi:hypothetical protein